MVQEIKSELINHIIPFWDNLRDNENGGYYGYVSYNLELNKKAEKGCILNNRIIWMYSNAYMLLGDERLLEAARHAYMALKNMFIDRKNGGVYWSVSYDGRPMDTTKHTYNQAFAVYALSSYYDATGDKEALKLAYDLVDIIETKCSDERGYLEAFDIEFNAIDNEKLSENGVEAKRTMNTLLHVMEAYTVLYRADKSEKISGLLKRALDIFYDKIYNNERGRMEVFFDNDYNTLIDLYSYGHDIETSWLLDRCLEVLEDSVYSNKFAEVTLTMAKNTLKYAFNGESLACESENGVINQTRIWWVQAETLIGLINLYQKTGDEEYKKMAEAEWRFIRDYQIDHRPGGEWYSEVTPEGIPDEKKETVGIWKCPYHNGRMCIEIIKRLGA